MIQIGNVELYQDDEEIIDLLHAMPVIDGFDGMPVLRYMDRMTAGSDFAVVVGHMGRVYVVYKFDQHRHDQENSGLLMTVSNDIYCQEQLYAWDQLSSIGIDLSKPCLAAIRSGLNRRLGSIGFSGRIN